MAKKDGESGNQKAVEDSELRGSPEMGVAVIAGTNFAHRSVVYYNVEGIAIVEGDIALGTIDGVKQATDEARRVVAENANVAFGVGITGSQFRWPNCRMPYVIDPNLPNQSRVTDAIAHWEARTAFRFPAKTASDANWVKFTDAGGCWSMVGMQGGEQLISLGPGCSTGNTIHEIGHAAGLWHEQSREDRDLFVTIQWENIQSGMSAQFNQHITDGDDLGPYDYGSIMHYPRKAFSKNGQDTIVPTDPNADIGQRDGLSAGDIGAVQAMYASCYRIRPNIKVIRDSRVLKRPVADLIVKPGIGPVKASLDPRPIRPGELVINPGALRPFGLATPHHAAGDEPVDTESVAAALYQQALDLEAAAAQARATAAQAAADAVRMDEAAADVAQAYSELTGGSE